jgi:hypothetical protein
MMVADGGCGEEKEGTKAVKLGRRQHGRNGVQKIAPSITI